MDEVSHASFFIVISALILSIIVKYKNNIFVNNYFINLLMFRNQNATPLRYSDQDLEIFKQLFEEKLSIAQKEQQQLLAMLAEESDEFNKELITQFLQRNNELIEHITN